MKGNILRFQGRTEEAVPENERALALDPSNVNAVVDLGFDYGDLGDFDKGLEYFDKAILLSPHDPLLAHSYGGKAWDNFALKRYDQAIEAARQAFTVNQTAGVQYIHAVLIAALALTGHETEAREALKRYLALPSTGPLKTIAAFKAYFSAQGGLRPASRRTSGSTPACARRGCRRNERSPQTRAAPICSEIFRFGR